MIGLQTTILIRETHCRIIFRDASYKKDQVGRV
jgi:hypothetical protein